MLKLLPLTEERVKSSSGPPLKKDFRVKSGAGLSGNIFSLQLKIQRFLEIKFEDFSFKLRF